MIYEYMIKNWANIWKYMKSFRKKYDKLTEYMIKKYV